MPLTKYFTYESMLCSDMRYAGSHPVVYLAADVEAVLKEAWSALDAASQYINGWNGCVPEEDARSKQWRHWDEVNVEINAALANLKGSV